MTDTGYATYLDPRLQPAEEPESNDMDCFGRCSHAEACERLYKRCIDAREHYGWLEDMARFLACEWCDEYEDRGE